jgi:oxygen-independent coproporphyrinogen-3 oxidase
MDLRKYNVPVPRYTSYPTVPFWDPQAFTLEGYKQSLQTAYWLSSKEVSLYIHLPFCESLCTYCACNTRITKNHGVEDPYIQHVLMEWDLYLESLPDKPTIREIHLGGGTPTFFSAKNLEALLKGILKKANVSTKSSMSFEGHPSNTTPEHLKVLNQLGFDRLSLGIQDFDLNVQKLINRLQTFEQVAKITEEARKIGYTSVNFDMVYGLPGQNLETLNDTLEKVSQLSPDRIAYYSYAHVPSMKPAQKSYEDQLPNAELKYQLMAVGKQKMVEFGYKEIGFDHFVKPEDELMKAYENRELHRNFMGYTPFSSKLLIGLGVSAISDSWTGFAQNEKTVEAYYEKLDNKELPITRGHLLTQEDLFLRQHILNLMCNFETEWEETELLKYGVSINFTLLEQLAKEGFIQLPDSGIKVLPEGKDILRIICSALDARLANSGKYPEFSKSV